MLLALPVEGKGRKGEGCLDLRFVQSGVIFEFGCEGNLKV